MKTVTSVSGGKTSAMMALEFPTDHYIFAVVLTDHELSAPKDKGLLRECQNRIPWFVASHEADLTLLNMLRQAELEPDNLQWWLEQEEKTGHTFGKRPLKTILTQPLLDVYGDREPCHCTD